MATSITNSLELHSGTYGITFEVTYKQTYDVDTNKSTVAITNLRVKTSGDYLGQYYLNGTLSVDGKTVVNMNATNGTHLVNINAKNTYYKVSGTLGSTTITHDENDAMSVTFTLSQVKAYQNNSVVWTHYGESATIELAKLETNGFIYIDNGTSFDKYEVYIDNGTSWDRYIPYIDNGTDWDKCE